ncbi:unnamed protein product [Closterium sp. NIES-53]
MVVLWATTNPTEGSAKATVTGVCSGVSLTDTRAAGTGGTRAASSGGTGAIGAGGARAGGTGGIGVGGTGGAGAGGVEVLEVLVLEAVELEALVLRHYYMAPHCLLLLLTLRRQAPWQSVVSLSLVLPSLFALSDVLVLHVSPARILWNFVSTR